MPGRDIAEYNKEYYAQNRMYVRVRQSYTRKKRPKMKLSVWKQSRYHIVFNERLAMARRALRAKQRTEVHNAFSFVVDLT
jgi:hypothetical protein